MHGCFAWGYIFPGRLHRDLVSLSSLATTVVDRNCCHLGESSKNSGYELCVIITCNSVW